MKRIFRHWNKNSERLIVEIDLLKNELVSSVKLRERQGSTLGSGGGVRPVDVRFPRSHHDA